MPIKSATGTSKLTVQPLTPAVSSPSIGSLPATNQIRAEVPNVITQGEAYFSRDSIGSAKFDSRMDFPALPSNATVLSKPMGSTDKKISISPQRPCAIASIDIFAPSDTSKDKTEDALAQTLEIAEFNSQLLDSDYHYIYDSLKSNDATSAVMQVLEDTASSNLAKTNSIVSAISSLAVAKENFSQNLDIRVTWDNVSQKSAEYYSTFSTRFGSDKGDISLESLAIDPQIDTGTAIVKRIQSLVTNASSETAVNASVGNIKVGLSPAYFAIDNRVKTNDLLFDDGEIVDYSTLGRLEKVAACSEFLSRVFIDTFTGMTGSASINLPTAYSGSYIFEPHRLQDGNVTIPSHYDGIIDPSVKLLTSSIVDSFRTDIVKSYNDSYESAKAKTGASNMNEVGSPLDIYIRFLGKMKDSFPTLYTSIESSTISNQTELYDAINLLFSMKQTTSTKQFNGLMRGILLTTLLDQKYTFASDSGEEYDSVNESKSEIEDSVDGKRTIASKTGSKTLATKTLTTDSTVSVDSIFKYPDRLKNFPRDSVDFVRTFLTRMDSHNNWTTPSYDEYGSLMYLVANLDPENFTSLDNKTLTSYESFSKNAPRTKDVPSTIATFLPQGESFYAITSGTTNRLSTKIVDKIPNFGRDNTGKTVANAIIDFYDELVSVFEETYGKKLDIASPSGNFHTRDGTCTKRAIIDVILECMGNLTAYFLSLGYASKSKSLGANNDTDKQPTWYLSVDENFYESLTFCETVSQITGDLNAAITAAYSSSGLSKTGNTSFLNGVVSTIVSDLYPRHRGTKLAIASIAAIASVVDTSSQVFSKTLFDASIILTALQKDLKNDVLESLTTEISSHISMKEKFEYGLRESLEESLSKHDVSAAKWFYTNYKDDLSSDKTCLVLGLPVGFCNKLSKLTIEVSGDKIKTGSLSLYRSPSKYKLLSSSRSITRPHDKIIPLMLGRFNPLLHVYITSDIADNLLPLEIASSGTATMICFDRASGTWVETDYDEAVSFLTAGGNFGVSSFAQDFPTVTKDEVEDIIEFHVLDAILKSTIRATAGMNFDSMSLCSAARTIDSSSASKMISLFSLSPENLIPRGAMTASEFLTVGENGAYSPLPYSSLAGKSSNSTDPSTHSLLLKLLGSGIFTSGGLIRRIVAPPAFERVYCTVYDPTQALVQDKSGNVTEDSTINKISLLSLSVVAE